MCLAHCYLKKQDVAIFIMNCRRPELLQKRGEAAGQHGFVFKKERIALLMDRATEIPRKYKDVFLNLADKGKGGLRFRRILVNTCSLANYKSF